MQYLFLACLLVWITPCLSQETGPSISADHAYAKAVKFQEQSKYDSAGRYYNKAATAYERHGQWSRQADALNKVSSIYLRQFNHPLAASTIEKVIRLCKEKSAEESEQQASAYYNLGFLQMHSGEYDTAIHYIQKALNINKRLFGEKHRSVAQCYWRIGSCLDYKEEYEMAMENFRKAITIVKAVAGGGDSWITHISVSIGIIHYYRLEYEAALQRFNEALVAYDNPKFNDTPDEIRNNKIRALQFKGMVMQELGKYNEAMKCYNQAFAISSVIFGELNALSVMHYRTAGDVYQMMGDIDMSVKSYNKAIEIAQQLFGEKHPAFGTIYTNLSHAYYEKKDYSNALKYQQKSLISLVPSFNDPDPYALPSSTTDRLDQFIIFSSLMEKATILKLMYLQDKNIKDLKAAFQTYQLADTLLSEARRVHHNFNDKAELGKRAIDIYEGAIEVSLMLRDITQDQKYGEMAFYFSERNKAGLLTEALLDISAKGIGLVPDSLVSLETKLKEEKANLQSKLKQAKMSKENDSDIDGYTEKLFGVNQSIQALAKRLEKNYPKYYEYKNQDKVLQLPQVQALLPVNTSMVEFFEGNRAVYVFVVTGKEYHTTVIPRDSSYQELLNEFRQSVSQDGASDMHSKAGYDRFVSSSSRLYDLLFGKTLQAIATPGKSKRILVIPDGTLAYIPFDILLTKHPAGPDGNYTTLDYLLKSYPVVYGYSATLNLSRQQYQKSNKPQSKYLAFAPVYNEGMFDSQSLVIGKLRDNISVLKWNQHEVEALTENVGGRKYLADQATEAKFKSEATNYNIIHLAMHALVDDEDPMNSTLVFTQTNDTIEDGLLHAFELYNMQINAQLVVLSACNTGYGKLVKGEGVMSLARAFTYSGVSSVVMSHWRVDDEATSKLMNYFYENLNKGFSKGEALRQAKLSYLLHSNPLETHPFYWAAFLSIGDDSPVVFTNHYFLYALLFSLVLGVSAVGIFVWQTRKINAVETISADR